MRSSKLNRHYFLRVLAFYLLFWFISMLLIVPLRCTTPSISLFAADSTAPRPSTAAASVPVRRLDRPA